MKLWLDDARSMPSDYDVHVKSAFIAIELLKTGLITHIGLDHDLGPVEEVGNGHMVSDFIEEAAYHKTLKPLTWSIQSSNAVEVERMTVTLKRAENYWY